MCAPIIHRSSETCAVFEARPTLIETRACLTAATRRNRRVIKSTGAAITFITKRVAVVIAVVPARKLVRCALLKLELGLESILQSRTSAVCGTNASLVVGIRRQ